MKYEIIHVEFQLKGSLHIHSFLWILNTVQRTEDTLEDYIEFIDSILSASLPSEKENPLLYKLVKAFQAHSHSNTSRKYKNNLPCFIMGAILQIELLSLNHYVKELEKFEMLQKRE